MDSTPPREEPAIASRFGSRRDAALAGVCIGIPFAAEVLPIPTEARHTLLAVAIGAGAVLIKRLFTSQEVT